MTALTIAPSIRSSNAIQIKTKAINEGTDIIIAITVPLTMISRFVKLFFLSDKIEPKIRRVYFTVTDFAKFLG